MIWYRFRMLAEYLATNKVRELLCPPYHSAEVKRERYDCITSRAQLIAQLFAILTPA